MILHSRAQNASSFSPLSPFGVQRSLTKDALLMLLYALVISKVDCYSTVLAGVSVTHWLTMYSQCSTLPLVSYSRQDGQNMTPLLRDLHWLKVPERIKFSLCVLMHCCLHGTAPPYLAETLQRTSDMSSRHHLRSAATPTLVGPSTRRSTLGDWAFPVAAAHVWNSLPSSLRAVQSLMTFRHRLKAELFDSSITWLSYCTINMRVVSLILDSALAIAIAVSHHSNHSLV